jgi:arabinoxylan arabinofuranohydrolase
VFGFNYRLNFADTPLHRERRSVNVAELDYQPDGSIPKLRSWNQKGVAQIRPINPYDRVEAETMAWESRIKRDWDRPFDWATGVRTARDPEAGMVVVPVAPRAYIKVAGVEFGARSPKTLVMSVASSGTGGTIDVRIGSPSGTGIAKVEVPATGGEHRWEVVRVPTNRVSGREDIYFVFNAGGTPVEFKVDFWRFE